MSPRGHKRGAQVDLRARTRSKQGLLKKWSTDTRWTQYVRGTYDARDFRLCPSLAAPRIERSGRAVTAKPGQVQHRRHRRRLANAARAWIHMCHAATASASAKSTCGQPARSTGRMSAGHLQNPTGRATGRLPVLSNATSRGCSVGRQTDDADTYSWTSRPRAAGACCRSH
jgi:hypothetical protein